MTRPREGLRTGMNVGAGIDVPPNEWMNRSIREAYWTSPPAMTEILPEEMSQPDPAATHRIREAARELSHRLWRRP